MKARMSFLGLLDKLCGFISKFQTEGMGFIRRTFTRDRSDHPHLLLPFSPLVHRSALSIVRDLSLAPLALSIVRSVNCSAPPALSIANDEWHSLD
jgi:hypothetical protein